ncbi:MAG TPA: site-specific integrase [Acidobacteriaceae bacterium]|jgi:integrase|nr:site-specific integrase [Acidobacteriaceae bacterium]
MPNQTVTLLRYCRIGDVWKRLPVAYAKNGRLRPGYVLIDGKQIECNGHYVLRWFEGRKLRYQNVGENATDALTAKLSKEKLLTAQTAAQDAGIVLPEVEGRKYLRRAANLYVEDRKAQRKLDAAEHAELVLGEFIASSGRTFLDEVSKQDVLDYQGWLRKQGQADHTIANKHNRLRAFFKFAGFDTKTFMPEKPKFEKTLPTTYAQEDIDSLVSAADSDPYMMLVIKLGYQCGLREQEMEFLEWADIHWTDSVLRVRGKMHWGFKPKDSEQRDVPIPSDLLALLKDWRAKHLKTRLVLGTGKDHNKPNGHLLRNLKALAKRAGLACKECDGCKGANGCSQFTLHKLRRTYGTTLLRAGVDVRTVQALLGHSDLESTLRYLRPAGTKETQSMINGIFGSKKAKSKG